MSVGMEESCMGHLGGDPPRVTARGVTREPHTIITALLPRAPSSGRSRSRGNGSDPPPSPTD